jgi:hypothetical protein
MVFICSPAVRGYRFPEIICLAREIGNAVPLHRRCISAAPA